MCVYVYPPTFEGVVSPVPPLVHINVAILDPEHTRWTMATQAMARSGRGKMFEAV